MRCGDIVYCASGVGVVDAISVRPVEDIYKVELSNGTSTKCTGNHLWFTSRGWTKTCSLEVGEIAYGIEEVRSLWQRVSSMEKYQERGIEGFSGSTMEQAEVLLAILCQEIKEPNERTSGEIEGEGKAEGVKAQAYKAWRERAIATFAAACATPCFGGRMGGGSCSSYACSEGGQQREIPHLLQNRHSEQREENRYRGRRKFTHDYCETGAGCKENSISGKLRVVGVSRIERKGVTPVFNLQVSGHPSFFANGALVHNCHLIPNDGEGMYRTFLSNLEKSQTEGFRVIGLTATPFRTGEGKIYGKDRFFARMVYESDIIQLIDEGFLCDMKSGEAKGSVDTSSLHRRGGEFIAEEVEELFSNNVTVDAVNEIVNATVNRHSVMIFATSVKHACYIENLLHMHPGVSPDEVGTVFGSTSPLERAATIAAFIDRRIKFLLNVDVLTTGFDAPCIDAIAILRATASPGLYAQIVGRGLRTHGFKQDCIVLDFGENIKRHGSIDRIRARRVVQAAREKVEAEAKEKNVGVKECPRCEVLNLETVLQCECGYAFPVEGRHNAKSESILAIVGKTPPQVFDVIEVQYSKWSKPEKPDTMRVDYRVSKDGKEVMFGMSEWICFDHTGYARKQAEAWWVARSNVRLPESTRDAISMATLGAVAEPTQIVAEHDGKYWTIKRAVVLDKPNEYQELEEAPSSWIF
jgi:DNA repair protein RadD